MYIIGRPSRRSNPSVAWDEALKYVDQSIKVKPTFRNLSARATVLWNARKKKDALAADQALAQGKTEGADTSAFEKRVAGWKSGR